MRLTSHSCQLHYIFVNTHFFGCLRCLYAIIFIGMPDGHFIVR